jgi:hypothetical protein
MSTQTGLNKKDTFGIAMSMSEKLNGLTVKEANSVIEWLQASVNGFVKQQQYNNNYFETAKEWMLSPKMSASDLKL